MLIADRSSPIRRSLSQGPGAARSAFFAAGLVLSFVLYRRGKVQQDANAPVVVHM